MADERLYIENLIEVPVRQLSKFLKFIAKHNLWDELEQHLKDRGCNKLVMSFEPVKAIGNIIEKKSSELVAEHKRLASAGPKPLAMRCASNQGTKPGPVTPDGGASDRRLKKDVVYLTTLENGIKLYSFKYIWSDESYVGVMAQDLLLAAPHRNAVTLTQGYYVVDYKALGLKMITLKEWSQSPQNIFCALELHIKGGPVKNNRGHDFSVMDSGEKPSDSGKKGIAGGMRKGSKRWTPNRDARNGASRGREGVRLMRSWMAVAPQN